MFGVIFSSPQSLLFQGLCGATTSLNHHLVGFDTYSSYNKYTHRRVPILAVALAQETLRGKKRKSISCGFNQVMTFTHDAIRYTHRRVPILAVALAQETLPGKKCLTPIKVTT